MINRFRKNHSKGLTCFSFAMNGVMFRFGGRKTWLGWKSYTLGGLLLRGKIYEAVDTGIVVTTKTTTSRQDQLWLNWMRKWRVDTEDVYSVARHNCRTYAQWEFRDAP